MKYEVFIRHTDGSGSYLMHRGRTCWSLRTARKHARDILTGRTGVKTAATVTVIPC
jgi:hypothetical protein